MKSAPAAFWWWWTMKTGKTKATSPSRPKRSPPKSSTSWPPMAAAMGGHEVDDFGGDLFGRDGEVAFVFPVFIVHHHQNAAGADFIDSLGDGHEGHTLYYGGTGFSL